MSDFLMPSHNDPMKALKWFIGAFIILWILWFIFVGPEKAGERAEKPFIKPAAPLDSGEVYGPGER